VAVTPLRPTYLVRHARALAQHRSGRGRPSVTWLRRASSAAYYAVFHRLSTDMAWHLLPHGSDQDRYRLARSVPHTQISDLCSLLTRTGGNLHVQPMVDLLRKDADLVALARLFIDLQQARHDADYNHLAPVRKATTLGHIADPERALDLANRLAATPNYESFLSLLALKSSLK
jgi:hypothetical protein